jgi:hypothetical protein
MDQGPDNLEGVIGKLDEAARENGAKVSVGEVVDTVGRRSFGPLLLLGGLLGMSPLGLIPTAPTVLAIVTLLIALQLIFGRETIWIPRFLARLSIPSERMAKAVMAAKAPARVVDRVVKPRLAVLTSDPAERLAAMGCALAALAIPPLEFVPFAVIMPAAAVAAFGLGLIARDGLLMLLAFIATAGAAGLVGYALLR